MNSDIKIPLAERIRPESLEDYVGQQHLVGKGSVLRNMIESGNLSSFILWGPPGVGKTTLAHIISKQLDRAFFTLSAVSSGVKEVREVFAKAKSNLFNQKTPILFIDEIHRFNKGQQDALLGAVEEGTIILIGATTENPSFEVNSPLLSRCQVFVLKELTVADLEKLLDNAIKKDPYLSSLKIEIKEKEALFRYSGGDARKLLNVLDIIINSTPEGEPVVITNDLVMERLQENMALYDKNGEQHYDIISAFIKSLRGSDPNGAVYWLARMIKGGEDPLFIARRMVILAAEDIGLANPNALLLAQSTFAAVQQIGMPEGRIPLSECAIYLATSPKSNSAYMAIDTALGMVSQAGDLSVPLHLRNAPTKLMAELGYHQGYKYAHDFEGNFADLEFLPEEIKGTKIYDPSNNKSEQEIRRRLNLLWKKYNY
ncbi:MAG: replication-associated recombination protein A [Bacteroidales bacterium]|nr:replication-associated recombination protein A [Bacteroidales bacterium]MBR4980458.1 replication-associated recombination protein A [Bacteroidales bacterium]MBR5907406.1 replication-associated recombination protein A [Bacteroidales bacterium]